MSGHTGWEFVKRLARSERYHNGDIVHYPLLMGPCTRYLVISSKLWLIISGTGFRNVVPESALSDIKGIAHLEADCSWDE